MCIELSLISKEEEEEEEDAESLSVTSGCGNSKTFFTLHPSLTFFPLFSFFEFSLPLPHLPLQNLPFTFPFASPFTLCPYHASQSNRYSFSSNPIIILLLILFETNKNVIFQLHIALGVVVLLKVMGKGKYWCSICWWKKMTRSYCWIFSRESLQVNNLNCKIQSIIVFVW